MLVLATMAIVARQEAESQRLVAESALETTQQVSTFLTELFEVSYPSEALGNSITAREILDQGAKKIERQLAEQPLVKSRMLLTIGDIYLELGLLDQAIPLLEQGLQLQAGPLQVEHMELSQSRVRLFAKLKEFRRVATHYDKRLQDFIGFATIAAFQL